MLRGAFPEVSPWPLPPTKPTICINIRNLIDGLQGKRLYYYGRLAQDIVMNGRLSECMCMRNLLDWQVAGWQAGSKLAGTLMTV